MFRVDQPRPAAQRDDAGGPAARCRGRGRAAGRRGDAAIAADDGAVRLQKVLADRGLGSRRASEELIRQGRVRVDGRVVDELGTRVAPDARIEVDGRALHPASLRRYVMLNKPLGVLSTARDERGRRTVVDLVPSSVRLFPVGRLDADSEGLLLLTNDGEWANRLLHPRYEHEREYEVTAVGRFDETVLRTLRRGVRLEEGLARALALRVLSTRSDQVLLRMVLKTGWKRQVRRMCAAIGLRVTKLVRVRVGSLRLGALPAGRWRELTPAEVRAAVKVG